MSMFKKKAKKNTNKLTFQDDEQLQDDEQEKIDIEKENNLKSEYQPKKIEFKKKQKKNKTQTINFDDIEEQSENKGKEIDILGGESAIGQCMTNYQEINQRQQDKIDEEKQKVDQYLQELKEKNQEENNKLKDLIEQKQIENLQNDDEQMVIEDDESKDNQNNQINDSKNIVINSDSNEDLEIQSQKIQKQGAIQIDSDENSSEDEYMKKQIEDSKNIRKQAQQQQQQRQNCIYEENQEDFVSFNSKINQNITDDLDKKRFSMVGDVNENQRDVNFQIIDNEEDFSDEEFAELEGKIVNNATKQSNYNQKFGVSRQEKFKALKQSHKLFSFENISLDQTIELISQNLLTSKAVNQKVSAKLQRFEEAKESSQKLIDNYQETLDKNKTQVENVQENVDYWEQFMDMNQEKELEVNNAYFQARDLDQQFHQFKLQQYKDKFNNEIIKKYGGTPIDGVQNKINNKDNGKQEQGDQDIDILINNNINLHQLNKNNMVNNNNNNQELENLGDSSDTEFFNEDEVDQENRIKLGLSEKHFSNKKVALFSACLDIFSNIEEEYIDFDEIRQNCIKMSAQFDEEEQKELFEGNEYNFKENYQYLYLDSIQNISKLDIIGYDPLCFAAKELQYYGIQDFKQISVIEKLLEEKEYQISKVIIENIVYERIQDNIKYLFYPFSQKQTENLKKVLNFYIDFCYKDSDINPEKSKKSLELITNLLQCTLDKFTEFIPFCSNLELNLQNQVGFKRNFGKHMKFIKNIISLSDILPPTNVYKIVCENLFLKKILPLNDVQSTVQFLQVLSERQLNNELFKNNIIPEIQKLYQNNLQIIQQNQSFELQLKKYL